MRFLLLSPHAELSVINLVAASSLVSIGALAASKVRSAEPLRHAILTVGLLLMVLSPLPILVMSLLGIGLVSVSQAPEQLADSPVVQYPDVAAPPPVPDIMPPRFKPIGVELLARSTSNPSIENANDLSAHNTASLNLAANSGETGHQPGNEERHGESTKSVFGISISIFVAVWIIVAGGLIIRLLRNLLLVRQLRLSVCDSRNPRLIEIAERIRLQWGISASVFESNMAPVPLTMGIWRPIIIVPRGLADHLDDEELECILSHEAAHIFRRDTTIALIQQTAAVAYWWNPLLHIMNSSINSLRERLCDACVVQRRGEGLTLARSLVLVAEWLSCRWNQLPLVVPLLEKDDLEQRILILTSENAPASIRLNRSSRAILLFAVCLVVGSSLVPLTRQQPSTSFAGTVAFTGPAAPQPPSQQGDADPATRNESSNANTEQEPEQSQVSSADRDNSVWPEGATVAGRVVDHLGVAVVNAEVILLGHERLIVDADSKTWFNHSGTQRRPNSTRTNSKGEFILKREQGEADRIAVIATSPILWVVPRISLPKQGNVELRLPPPGTLVMQCDLPGKAAKLPVMIESTSDGINSPKDRLRFHMTSFSLVNPGETEVVHLTPGHYAVQVCNLSNTGALSNLLTEMDRQIVEVKAERKTTVRFDRKPGRRIVGRVLGLDNADLRYGLLIIRHSGPEEMLDDGRRGKRLIGFDVLSIGSDGHFTLDPIPAGEYYADFQAVLASSPEQLQQSMDFSGRMSFTVPEQGELPKVEIIAKAAPRRVQTNSTELRIRAVDEDGQPIPSLQAMVHTEDAGYSPWFTGKQGLVFLGESRLWRSAVIDVLIRADGFVSSSQRFEGKQIDQLSRDEATITLRRGTPIELRFQLPPGMSWPKGALPETYFDNLQNRVRIMRQASNRRSGNGIDFNILNLRDTGNGRFELRLAEDTPPMHVAIHSPGFLQYFEAGTFTLADVQDAHINIAVPKPATMQVTFEPGEHARLDNLFKSASITLMRQLQGDSYSIVATSEDDALAPKLEVNDLAPGNYMADVSTQPQEHIKQLPDSEINLGTYSDRKDVTLVEGQHERISFRSVPYQPQAYRGPRTAVIRVKNADGKPASGQDIEVRYFDGHYGLQLVFKGPVPDSGEVALKGIADSTPDSRDAYWVTSNGKHLGSFGFQTRESTEKFEFSLIPTEGDMAPNIQLTNLTTNSEIELSSLRGKVVLLEFWATWCGPCQIPMQKLHALAAEQNPKWKDQVVIIPISIDNDRKRVELHTTSRGWKGLDLYWAGGSDREEFNAPAARAFVVSGVPEAILIGPDGRIRWRGHPLEQFSGKDLTTLINDLLQ